MRDTEQELEAERVVRTYGKLLTVVVRSILWGQGAAEDVEECVQDVFTEYLSGGDKWDSARGSEKTYLCVLARSRARTLRKRLESRGGVPLEEELLLTAPDEMERADVRDALRRALAGLTADERKLFTLRFVYEWDTAATAHELGVSRSAVTTRTQRLREKLRAALARQGIELGEKEVQVCAME